MAGHPYVRTLSRAFVLALSLVAVAGRAAAEPWVWVRMPHVAAGGGYTSHLTIRDLAGQYTSRAIYVYFYDDTGQPLTVNVDGAPMAAFNYAAAAWQERTFILTGTNPAMTDAGSIQIAGIGIGEIDAHVRLVGPIASGDVVNIPAVRPDFAPTLSISSLTPPDDIGLAVANPWATAAPITVNFDLYQAGARVAGTSRVTRAVSSRGHLSVFLSQLFPGAAYSGAASLRMSSADAPFIAVALRSDGAQRSSLAAQASTQVWMVAYSGVSAGDVTWSWQFVEGYSFKGYERNPVDVDRLVALRGVVAKDIGYFVAEWNYSSADQTNQGIVVYHGRLNTEGGTDVATGIRMQIKSDGSIVASTSFRATRVN